MIIDEIKNKEFLAKGKRGEVFIADYNNRKVAIKIKRKESLAQNRIEIETKFLKLLNCLVFKISFGFKIIYFFSLFIDLHKRISLSKNGFGI